MSAYPASPSFINHVLDDGTIIGQSPMRGGHPDADFDYDFGYSHLTGEQDRELAEIECDRAIQAADDAHCNELESVYAATLPLIGNASLRITRGHTIENICGRTVVSCFWTAMIDMQHIAAGASAKEAADAVVTLFRQAGNAAPSAA